MVDILFEDNHLLVVVKPQNIPSQEDESGDLDMLTMLKGYIKEKYNKPNNVYLGLVHRLDRPTGGIMVFAKTSKAASRISEQIKSGEFEKKYFTVVLGKPRQKSGKLENYLKKDTKENKVRIAPMLEEGAKKAQLVYKVLDSNEELSLVQIRLLTGRSHQIRVQMANIGNPVFGDAKYGGDKYGKSNLALYAYQLNFVHPVTKKKMYFVQQPPDMVPWKYFNIDKYI